jgi:hypothetical protein
MLSIRYCESLRDLELNQVLMEIPMAKMFTQKDGTQVEVPVVVVPDYVLTSVMALQEQFIQRGEHLSLLGVLLHVIDKGIKATEHYWDAAEKNKDKRDFAKQAVSFFGADGSITDPDGLRNLAIAKGIIKQPANGNHA